jgi:lipoyl-dependent peroxiredoxin
MATRKAKALWEGTIKDGKGTLEVESGTFKERYSFSSRFEDGKGTNPEELIGAAHAGCFSMALSLLLGEEGYTPESISTEAEVELKKGDNGFSITNIHLNTEVKVSGIKEDEFLKITNEAKENCPVSKALKSVNITLTANLK